MPWTSAALACEMTQLLCRSDSVRAMWRALSHGSSCPQYPVRENMPRRTHVMAPAWTPRLRRRDSPGEVATRQRRRRSATSRCLSAAWAWLACRAAVCVIGPGWGRCEPAALEGFSGMAAPWFVSHASGETDGGFVRARAAGAAGAPILPESARAAAMPAANGSSKGVDARSSVPSGRIEDGSGASQAAGLGPANVAVLDRQSHKTPVGESPCVRKRSTRQMKTRERSSFRQGTS